MLHAKLVPSIDREYWMKKIWTTDQLESHEHAEPIKILYWFKFNGATTIVPDHHLTFGKDNRVCGPCYLTTDRAEEKTADAIVISNGVMYGLTKHGTYRGEEQYAAEGFTSPLPSFENRNLSQFWVFQNKESAIKGEGQTLSITKQWDSAFNLTNTYRRDSDVTRYFGDIETSIVKSDRETIYNDIIKSKQPYGKLIENYDTIFNTAWMVSNCDYTIGAVKRMEYGKSLLAAGLKLYTEGACFDNPTQRKFRIGRSAKPFDHLTIKQKTKLIAPTSEFPLSKMKFYLSFENAYRCNDYITEKFWRNAIGQKLVPIIFGPHIKDVKAIAPPNSFIHADDFNTSLELVEYLNYLDSNDTAYLQYHEWRTLYPEDDKPRTERIQDMGTGERALCELCRVIREKRKTGVHQHYKSVSY